MAQTVIWESSDPSTAAVSEDGVVEAVQEGTAVITATLPEKEMSENFIKRELYKIRQIPQTRPQNAPTRTGLYLKVMYFA